MEEYSKSTQRNLARLDEDRIDYDLLEELVTYIDQEHGPGAILVFLPGLSPSPCAVNSPCCAMHSLLFVQESFYELAQRVVVAWQH